MQAPKGSLFTLLSATTELSATFSHVAAYVLWISLFSDLAELEKNHDMVRRAAVRKP